MKILSLFEQLIKDGVGRHRLAVDSHPAEPVNLAGTDFICKLSKKPETSQVLVEIYLALYGFEDPEIKAGTYHLEAMILNIKAMDSQWLATVRILDVDSVLVNRQNDRLRVHRLPVQILRPGQTQATSADISDLSPVGMGILGEDKWSVGEVLEIYGLEKATGLAFVDPLIFEVRALPKVGKAGLLIASKNTQDNNSLFINLFTQLQQIQRFWQSLLDHARSQVGMAATKGAIISADFAQSQLLKRKTARRLLISDQDFEAVMESVLLLGKIHAIESEITALQKKHQELNESASDKKSLLLKFLNRLD